MRYLPLTNEDRKNMKKVIGISDINEMFTNVPKEVSLDPKFNLPNHKTEKEVGKILSEIANKNINLAKKIGKMISTKYYLIEFSKDIIGIETVSYAHLTLPTKA